MISLAAIPIVSFIAIRVYLGSSHGAQLASRKLSNALGMTVHIGSLSPGIESTGISSIEFEEANGANGGKPWAKVESIDSDVSIVGLALGHLPDNLILRNADVTLRFNAAGALLTRLPESNQKKGNGKKGPASKTPAIRLENSKVTFLQEGHPDSIISGINATLHEKNGVLNLTGDFKDETWGHWRLAANVNATSGEGHASLTTLDQVNVDPGLLRKVPLVRQAIWDAIAITGQTTAEINFDFHPGDNQFEYWVRAQPEHCRVHLTATDLTTTDSSGTVIVQNEIVTLENVRAQAASGKLEVNGTLNFHKQPNQIDVHVVAHKLKVDQLPEKWWVSKTHPGQKVLPPLFLRSDLDGDAHLQIVFAKSGPIYGGSGDATLRLRDFTAAQAEPIRLHLRPHPGGFEFEPKKGEPTSRLDSPRDNARTDLDQVALLLNLFTAEIAQPSKAPVPKKAAAPKKENYIDINLAFHDIDLNELIQKLNVSLPLKVGGKISIKVKASIPTDTSGDMKTYRFVGNASLPRLTIENLTLDNVLAKVNYRDGKLTLEDFSANLSDPNNPNERGSFKGTASLGLIPQGDLAAKLDLNQLPVGQIMGLFPDLAKGAGGSFTGQVELKAAAGQLRNPARWNGSANLSADRASALGWVIQQFQLKAKLAGGKLSLDKLAGNIEGAALDVSGDVKLSDKYAFQSRIDLKNVNLAALNKLNPKLKPPVDLAGQLEANAEVSGDLRPFAIQAAGKGAASDLKIQGFPIDKLSFRWDMDQDHVKVADFQTQLFGGNVTGSADLPLSKRAAGNVKLEMKGVDLTELSKKTPSLEGLKLEGASTGSLRAIIPAAKGDQSRAVTGDIDIRATKLKVQNIPADSLHAKADYRDGQVKYKVDAAALGGTIELEGVYPPAPEKTPLNEPRQPQGLLKIEKVKLARLWNALGLEKTLGSLYGEVNLNLPYFFDRAGKPEGWGTVRIDDLGYADHDITSQIESAAHLTAGELRFERISADLDSGTVEGLVIINLQEFDRSKAILRLRDVPARSVLFPFGDWARQIETPLDASIRTSLGRHFRGTMVLGASGGSIMGYELGTLRVPIEWDVVPSQQRGEIAIHDFSGEMARGRLSGRASFEFFGDFAGRVEGDLSFQGINIPSLVRTGSDLGSYGIGRASGKFEFSGTNVHSFDDLSGKLNATLGRAQLSGIPILRDVLPFLGASARTAQKSDVRATLARGTWNVERLTLLGANLQLYARGTITNSGRVDLNMNANTGQLSPGSLGIAALASRVPLVGAMPGALLAELSVAVTGVTVNLSVTGTVSNPSVQIRPVRTLNEEALRFFLLGNNNNAP